MTIEPAQLISNPGFWKRAIVSCDFSGLGGMTPTGNGIRGEPCPASLRIPLRAVLRESFRRGNHSAPLADPWLEIEALAAGTPKTPGLTSILIPVRGAHDYLALCLRRVLAHTTGEYEVVVACAESEREFVEYQAADWDSVRVVTSPEPQGYPANVNLARGAARGDVLVLLNSDAFVTAGWLEKLLAAVALPGVVAAGPALQIQPDKLDPKAGNADTVIDVLAGYCADSDGLPRRHRTRRLVGFCMAIRAEAFDAVGGVCEDFGIGNWDDDDLSLRLLLTGGDLLALPDVFVVHPASRSFAELPDADATYKRLLVVNERVYLNRWGWIIPDLNKWLDESEVESARHNIFAVETER